MSAQPRKALRSARIGMFVQSGLGIVTGVALLVLLGTSDVDDGELVALLAVSTVLALALFLCALLLPRRLAWVRIATIAIESVNVLAALWGLFASLVTGGAPSPAVVLPIVLSMLVLRPLLQPEVRDWFAGHRATAP
ncbi:hypothetical protein [Amycolatopsis australiensis]|uniref:Uncharacterized protein n=1 Tax=Amycolatopsis australiensis TaxID=546364 RepID=A0A1K1S1U0_9PSEU|nr:hypothetical protein [Amycolatopsis australiensis]SFW78323.1 hypothetical protein SAMN04489730_4497 [Amycolatopsis australiensis]